MKAVQEVGVFVLCILCVLVSLATSTILSLHFAALPVIKRNILTRQNQLLVTSCAACICIQSCTFLLVLLGGPLIHPVILYTLVLGSLTMFLCLLITLSATRMFIIFWVGIS